MGTLLSLLTIQKIIIIIFINFKYLELSGFTGVTIIFIKNLTKKSQK